MKKVDFNLTGLEISILDDEPITDPDQLDIKGLNFGYVILLIGGLCLWLSFSHTSFGHSCNVQVELLLF